MNRAALKAITRVASKLNPMENTGGRVSWDPGDPICPEWQFPLKTKLEPLIAVALHYHVPIGCWPVGPPTNITGVRVVVGRSVAVR